MDTLQVLDRKIRTAHDLLAVVKTMKSLAAVNIRQYEGAAVAMNEYASVIERAWQAFFRNRPQLQGRKRQSETLCLVLGSDQGMCGQFNDVIIQHAFSEIRSDDDRFEATTFWSAGERVRGGLEEEVRVAEHFFLPSSTDGIADLIGDIVERLILLRHDRPVDRFVIFYNHLGRSGTYEPSMHRVLPLGREWSEEQRRRQWPTHCFPMLGGEPTDVFEELFHQHIFAAVFKTFAQSMASENAARLVAMQAAEKNILEMEDDLQGRFRATRQDAITAELLDIISGFESLDPEA